MAVRQFDELKRINKELDEVAVAQEIAKYFEEMDLPSEEIELRIRIANDFQRFFQNLFFLMLTGEALREKYINDIRNEYIKICDRYDLIPNMEHINRLAETVVDNTLQNIDKEFYTSIGRTVSIAETETNSSANYDELQDMIANGMTQKTWQTMQDNRVRKSHAELDGVTIPIEDMFSVGNAEMLYPCDELNGFDYPEELVGCRCTCVYS
jgi:uncharacterized protein with gpF-like domain